MDRLQLFALQTYDLTKFGGPILLELGTYRDDPRIIAAQRELYSRLATKQVVWLSQTPPYVSSKHISHYIHEVDVDRRDVKTVIDGLIWNHIIRDDPRYIPPEDHVRLRDKATFSAGDYNVALRKFEDDYLAQRLPPNLWDGVCKNSIEYSLDDVLLEFPFTHSVVTSVIQVSAEMVATGYLGMRFVTV